MSLVDLMHDFPGEPISGMDVTTIPKAELHCHSDQLLDPSMVDALAADGHPLDFTSEDLAARYPFDTLDSWMNGYGTFVEPCLEPVPRWHSMVIEHHVARLRPQGVRYAELFLSQWLGAFDDAGALVDAFHELRERVDRVSGKSLQVAFVICVGRGTVEKFARQVPKILALSRAGLVCGVAVAGREDVYPIRPWQALLDQVHAAGLGLEIHAGEFAGPESVQEALEYGNPQRIGHGIRAFDDPSVLEMLMERDVHLEFCPTSNVKLRIVDRLEDHPIGRAKELGMSFSINTDDPGPFECSMTSEFQAVHDIFGFDEEDFAAVFASSMAAAFGAR